MVNIKRILCPVDFSTVSRGALNYAVTLARWYQADVTALHVFEVPVAGAYPGPWMAALPSDDELEAHLSSFVDQSRDPRVRIDIAVRTGNVVHEIAAAVGELGADLVVMGTHGDGIVAHLLLGSVTEKVLRTSSCPVMIVPPTVTHPTAPPNITQILCPVDFGPATLRSLAFAFSLAQEAHARLTVLHVLEPLRENPPESNVPEYPNLRKSQAREQLHAAITAGVDRRCAPVEMLSRGKPSREILRVAAERKADLIVMGVSGEGVIGRMLFGSTTNLVVREATCPVLTLPTPVATERTEAGTFAGAGTTAAN
jgi:nucleotide-binding universal stress UspA family protein